MKKRIFRDNRDKVKAERKQARRDKAKRREFETGNRKG
jgi:hypothetical protein